MGRFFSRKGLGAALIALATAGCGTGATTPPHIDLSLVAPTDGATVYVRSVTVFGHVDPGDARVLVAGRWARVHRGVFRMRLRLPLPVNHIGILAAASGYRPASLTTTVRVGRSSNGLGARSPRATGQPQPGLPSDFATRGEAICSAANQQLAALANPTAETLSTIEHQDLAIRTSEDRQLIALTSSAAHLPPVRTFLNDLQVKMAISTGVFNDLLQGQREAALKLVRHGLVLAPQWWQHAGRIGVPDCGAVWVPAGDLPG
jgi:hypothetical protein